MWVPRVLSILCSHTSTRETQRVQFLSELSKHGYLGIITSGSSAGVLKSKGCRTRVSHRLKRQYLFKFKHDKI